MKYILITASPEIAQQAQEAGVDRIMVDLEIIGKRERQGHLSTVISGHTVDDVRNVRKVLRAAEMIVRVNPLGPSTSEEVDQVIDAGADLLMLPMFHSARELATFCSLVRGRKPVIGLMETPGAIEQAEEVIRVPGLSEAYVGLNDLHLGLGKNFIFEPLALGIIDRVAGLAHRAGLPFGFGGIARVGQGLIPAEKILGEHLRLGSTRAILSRTFHGNAGSPEEFRSNVDVALEVRKLRAAEVVLAGRLPDEVERNRADLWEIIARIAQNKRACLT